MTSFSGVTFVLFCFVFVFMFLLKPRRFVQSSFDMQAPLLPHILLSFFFSFVYLEMSLFPSIFCTIAVFFLYGEYGFPSQWRFLPCDHEETGFLTSAYVKIQSIKQTKSNNSGHGRAIPGHTSTWSNCPSGSRCSSLRRSSGETVVFS